MDLVGYQQHSRFKSCDSDETVHRSEMRLCSYLCQLVFTLHINPVFLYMCLQKNECAGLCVYTYTNDTPPDLKALKLF